MQAAKSQDPLSRPARSRKNHGVTSIWSLHQDRVLFLEPGRTSHRSESPSAQSCRPERLLRTLFRSPKSGRYLLGWHWKLRVWMPPRQGDLQTTGAPAVVASTWPIHEEGNGNEPCASDPGSDATSCLSRRGRAFRCANPQWAHHAVNAVTGSTRGRVTHPLTPRGVVSAMPS